MSKLTLLLIFFLLFPSLSLANASSTTSTIPMPSLAAPDITAYDNDFSFSGYIQASYNYLLRSNHFTSGTHDRLFDLEPNGFTLQQAAITVAKQPTWGFGGLLNLILGRDANTLSPAGMNPNYFGIQNLGLTPAQAYLQYRWDTFTLLAGKYNCLMGAENYNPTIDSNFSRSILDGYAEPGTFIGIKAHYTVNNKLDLTADINNGWDTIQYTSRQKTLEVGISYAPLTILSLAATGMTGIQPVTDGASFGPTGRRNAFDFVGKVNATDKLTLIANYDYGMQTKAALATGQGRASWQGLAGYVNYQYNDKWQPSLRGEIFSDQKGYRTGVRQVWKELTLSIAYSVLKNLQISAETRHDFSNVKSFVTINGIAANNNQQSFALAGLYKF